MLSNWCLSKLNYSIKQRFLSAQYLNVCRWERMCLRGGTAYHLAHTRHWWDCLPPGPVWDRVSLLISCSTGIFPY